MTSYAGRRKASRRAIDGTTLRNLPVVVDAGPLKLRCLHVQDDAEQAAMARRSQREATYE